MLPSRSGSAGDTDAEMLLAVRLLSFQLGTSPAIRHSLDLVHGKQNVI